VLIFVFILFKENAKLLKVGVDNTNKNTKKF